MEIATRMVKTWKNQDQIMAYKYFGQHIPFWSLSFEEDTIPEKPPIVIILQNKMPS